MNVIYFFIILAIVNIAMFLLLTQCLGYYKNKSETIRGLIIVGSCLIFTVISALIYSGMIGWTSQENYEWNLNQGFKVSPLRKQCMGEGVCRNFTSKENLPGVLSGKCSATEQTEMNTLNFPPRLSTNCMVNPDEEDYGSGCHKWTVGWSGNPQFPMTYSNWIDDPGMSDPRGWPRPDATSNSVSYIPPTASCVGGIKRPQPPSMDYTMPWDSYSTLGHYAQPQAVLPQFPTPAGDLSEQYTPTFLNCSGRIRKK